MSVDRAHRRTWIASLAAAVVAGITAGPAQAQQVRVPEIQIQIPDVQIPEMRFAMPQNIRIPEMRFSMPEIRIPEMRFSLPTEIRVPEIRVTMPANLMHDMSAAMRTAGVVLDEAVQNRDFRIEQVHRENRTLAIGANGTLELTNISGNIAITANNGKEATVEIVRTSRGRTDADAKTGLDRVKAIVEHRGDRATIRPDYPNERNSPYSVSIGYVVSAPAGTAVTISSISGAVTIKDMKGGLTVQLTSGPVSITGSAGRAEVRTISGDVTLTDFTSDAALSVGVISGTVRLDRIKARRFTADVTSGTIIARDVTADAAEIKSISGEVEYSGALTRGGRYELQTHSGSIRFNPSGSTGFDLQASTFSGNITPDASVGLKTTTTSRRSLRGTVGDGGAVVVLTAFSGNVTISKK